MDPTRRQVFFHWLRSVVKADVALLQETHCNTVARDQRWSREWGGLDRAARRNECERVHQWNYIVVRCSLQGLKRASTDYKRVEPDKALMDSSQMLASDACS